MNGLAAGAAHPQFSALPDPALVSQVSSVTTYPLELWVPQLVPLL